MKDYLEPLYSRDPLTTAYTTNHKKPFSLVKKAFESKEVLP
jgi:hypothetical protein